MEKFSFKIKNRLTARNKFVIDYCGRVEGKRVLDIGCSFGWLEKALLAKGARDVVGIEPEKSLFYDAIKEVPGAKFKIGSALKIPFKKETFDITIFLEVLEHLPKGSERIAFSEISRVTKKGGRLIFSTPNNHLLSCLLDPAWYFGHRHYNLSFLKKVLAEYGFQIEDIFLYGGIWELFRMISHYFFKWVFNKEDPFKSFFEKRIADDGNKTDGYAYIYLKAIKK